MRSVNKPKPEKQKWKGRKIHNSIVAHFESIEAIIFNLTLFSPLDAPGIFLSLEALAKWDDTLYIGVHFRGQSFRPFDCFTQSGSGTHL